MVLECHDHTGVGGMRQALPDRVDAPLQGVFVGVPLESRLVSVRGHQVVERTDRPPAPGIQADGRDAHLVREVDAVLRVIDCPLPLFRAGIDEVLMNRKHREGESQIPGATLEVVHVRLRFVAHLAMQDFDPVEPQAGSMVDDLLDRVLLFREVPVRIGRDRQRNAWTGIGLGFGRGIGSGARHAHRACADRLEEPTPREVLGHGS